MTFTLDEATADRIDRTAERLRVPKSGVVRQAIREYAARVGMLSESERLRLLEVFDRVLAGIPSRPLEEVEQEIAALRGARREGGRRTRPRRPR